MLQLITDFSDSSEINPIVLFPAITEESPIKEVTMSDMTITVKDGTTLRRGLVETIPITISVSSLSCPHGRKG